MRKVLEILLHFVHILDDFRYRITMKGGNEFKANGGECDSVYACSFHRYDVVSCVYHRLYMRHLQPINFILCVNLNVQGIFLGHKNEKLW